MKSFIPRLIATITRKPRERVVSGVDFQWNSKLWIHNLFRVWELVAGRRAGVRCEASLTVNEIEGHQIVVQRRFYTWESMFVHFEGQLRFLLKTDPTVAPRFAFAMAGVILSAKLGQMEHMPIWIGSIAYGNSANGGNITSSGSSIMVIGGIMNIAGDIGTVQFNSVNCNQIDSSTMSASHTGYSYMLKNQAATSGFTNVGSSNWNIYYYTGVAQNDTAGTVNNHGKTSGTSTAPSGTLTPTGGVTKTLVWCTIFTDSVVATTSGFTNMANHTGQGTPSSACEDAGDSGLNTGTPTAQTQSETLSISGNWAVLQVAMQSTDSVAPSNSGFLAFM